MDKMKFETPDMAQMNVEKIAALFPNCVTESKAKDGKLKKAVNFDALKQMLGESVAEGNESYEFTWVGKRDAMVEAAKPIRKTLRPCVEESKNFDTTENLYIEGDNLEALKLLQEGYLGKVKMIYIDPPYNTGNDFIYKDDFRMDSAKYAEESGAVDDEGNRMVQNSDSNGRFHSDWCSMIYSRLLLARNLLTDDGVIFISIDDNEQANLKKICDEVFGGDCFVGDIAWQRTYSTRNDSKGLVREIEHILSYSRQQDWMPNALPRTAEMNAIYKNPDNDVQLWTSDNPFASGASTHQGMVYAIQHPFTGEYIYPSANAHWRYQQTDMLNIMREWGKYVLKKLDDSEKRAAVCGISADEVRKDVLGIVLDCSLEEAKAYAQSVYNRGQWPKFYFTKNGLGGIRRKTYLDAVGGKLPTNFWSFEDAGHTDEAKKEILALFDGKAPFDTPKPTRLLDRILTIATDKDSVVLDFFSGSATTAHSVFKKNAEDGGNRKFILVQVPEETKSPTYKTICEIGKERIRRAGDKILAEQQAKEKSAADKTDLFNSASDKPAAAKPLDIGFRVLKIDDSNMKDVYYSAGEISQQDLVEQISNIKDGRTDMDLLFGCLVDWGVPLSLPIKTETIENLQVYNVNDGDLVACFANDIPEAAIRQIAATKPLRAVFRDSSFKSDSAKINVTEIFKTISPNTTVKVV
ncbi:MAG: site-specific DNA-methyltransferase [Fibrobacter sp.]|uniref:site-specific DNA-methyltransferase n=1 Tax=Fibrobacter sp. TaxID=35828 RepID=UPI0025BCE6A5|nr:site-specific DNA-methyltransferase [Fibrobacter sp.]MBQ7080247.1 site-specific DNA-methyltransferase [Fibrobacter sp.]